MPLLPSATPPNVRIARIYPLRRMPRRFDVFDYIIPDHLNLQRGDFVLIQLRMQEIGGVVACVTDKHELPLTKLKRLIGRIDLLGLTDKELSFYEWLALDLVQSVSSVMQTAIPFGFTHGKRTVAAKSPTNIRSSKTTYNLQTDLVDSRDWIVQHEKMGRHPTIVIAPTVRDAQLLFHYLPNDSSYLYTGSESRTNRQTIWDQFRFDPHGRLIGTRMAALLTHPSLESIVVVRATHEQHKQNTRNPRFDARINARKLATLFDAQLNFFDHSCRVDESDLLQDALMFSQSTKTLLIDIQQERRHWANPLFSPQTDEQIEQTLAEQRRVLILHNNKQKTYGITSVHAWLQKQYPDVLVSLFDAKSVYNRSAQINVVTQAYLEQVYDQFNPERYGLVILLDADLPLSFQQLSRTEKALQNLFQWKSVANRCNATYLIQTQNLSLTQQFLHNPLLILKTEQQTRRDLQQPPYARWITVRKKNSSKVIPSIITDDKTEQNIDGTALTLRTSLSNQVELLTSLKDLDDDLIIDTHPLL